MDSDNLNPQGETTHSEGESPWYFDLPSGAWERQEAKNRELRDTVQHNIESAKKDPLVPRRHLMTEEQRAAERAERIAAVEAAKAAGLPEAKPATPDEIPLIVRRPPAEDERPTSWSDVFDFGTDESSVVERMRFWARPGAAPGEQPAAHRGLEPEVEAHGRTPEARQKWDDLFAPSAAPPGPRQQSMPDPVLEDRADWAPQVHVPKPLASSTWAAAEILGDGEPAPGQEPLGANAWDREPGIAAFDTAQGEAPDPDVGYHDSHAPFALAYPSDDDRDWSAEPIDDGTEWTEAAATDDHPASVTDATYAWTADPGTDPARQFESASRAAEAPPAAPAGPPSMADDREAPRRKWDDMFASPEPAGSIVDAMRDWASAGKADHPRPRRLLGEDAPTPAPSAPPPTTFQTPAMERTFDESSRHRPDETFDDLSAPKPATAAQGDWPAWIEQDRQPHGRLQAESGDPQPGADAPLPAFQPPPAASTNPAQEPESRDDTTATVPARHRWEDMFGAPAETGSIVDAMRDWASSGKDEGTRPRRLLDRSGDAQPATGRPPQPPSARPDFAAAPLNEPITEPSPRRRWDEALTTSTDDAFATGHTDQWVTADREGHSPPMRPSSDRIERPTSDFETSAAIENETDTGPFRRRWEDMFGAPAETGSIVDAMRDWASSGKDEGARPRRLLDRSSDVQPAADPGPPQPPSARPDFETTSPSEPIAEPSPPRRWDEAITTRAHDALATDPTQQWATDDGERDTQPVRPDNDSIQTRTPAFEAPVTAEPDTAAAPARRRWAEMLVTPLDDPFATDFTPTPAAMHREHDDEPPLAAGAVETQTPDFEAPVTAELDTAEPPARRRWAEMLATPLDDPFATGSKPTPAAMHREHDDEPPLAAGAVEPQTPDFEASVTAETDESPARRRWEDQFGAPAETASAEPDIDNISPYRQSERIPAAPADPNSIASLLRGWAAQGTDGRSQAGESADSNHLPGVAQGVTWDAPALDDDARRHERPLPEHERADLPASASPASPEAFASEPSISELAWAVSEPRTFPGAVDVGFESASEESPDLLAAASSPYSNANDASDDFAPAGSWDAATREPEVLAYASPLDTAESFTDRTPEPILADPPGLFEEILVHRHPEMHPSVEPTPIEDTAELTGEFAPDWARSSDSSSIFDGLTPRELSEDMPVPASYPGYEDSADQAIQDSWDIAGGHSPEPAPLSPAKEPAWTSSIDSPRHPTSWELDPEGDQTWPLVGDLPPAPPLPVAAPSPDESTMLATEVTDTTAWWEQADAEAADEKWGSLASTTRDRGGEPSDDVGVILPRSFARAQRITGQQTDVAPATEPPAAESMEAPLWRDDSPASDSDVILRAFEALAAMAQDQTWQAASESEAPATETDTTSFAELFGSDGDALVAEVSTPMDPGREADYGSPTGHGAEDWGIKGRNSVGAAETEPKSSIFRLPGVTMPVKDQPKRAKAVLPVSKKEKGRVRGFALPLVACALVFLALFVTRPVQNFRVEGTSMYPTLDEGQYVIVDRVTYTDLSKWGGIFPGLKAEEGKSKYVFHGPERGDIVVLRNPRDTSQDLIKRIVGLPGESVEIREGKVYVNELLLQEPYVTDEWSDSRPKVTIPAGHYYVLGDNRGASLDSRSSLVGLVNKDHIVGRAFVTVWPKSKLGFVANESGKLIQPKDGEVVAQP